MNHMIRLTEVSPRMCRPWFPRKSRTCELLVSNNFSFRKINLWDGYKNSVLKYYCRRRLNVGRVDLNGKTSQHGGGTVVSTWTGVALLIQARDRLFSSAKLLALHVVTRIWIHAYGPFEYPGKDPSVGCTFHLKVRYVSLVNPDLTLFQFKKKPSQQFFVLYLLNNHLWCKIIIREREPTWH